MRYLLFYWVVFLGICADSYGQVVEPSPLGVPSLTETSDRPRGGITSEDSEDEVRKCLVNTALGQTHVRERTGNNDGAEVRKYLAVFNYKEGTPYCGLFVEWVYRQCGVLSNVRAPAVARNWIAYPPRLVWNRGYLRGRTVRVGDSAALKFPQRRGGFRCHVELVADWQDDDDIEDFVTVGGNTSAPRGVRGGEGVHKKMRDKDMAIIANHISVNFKESPKLRTIWK